MLDSEFKMATFRWWWCSNFFSHLFYHQIIGIYMVNAIINGKCRMLLQKKVCFWGNWRHFISFLKKNFSNWSGTYFNAQGRMVSPHCLVLGTITEYIWNPCLESSEILSKIMCHLCDFVAWFCGLFIPWPRMSETKCDSQCKRTGQGLGTRVSKPQKWYIIYLHHWPKLFSLVF